LKGRVSLLLATMHEAIIRPGEPADLEGAFALIAELAEYEKASHALDNSMPRMLEDGFGPNASFRFWVACKGDAIVGLALVYDRYSTWKGRCLFLEDLIVTESERGKGVGKALFEHVLETARAEGYAQLNWQVLDWNESAIGFYNEWNPIWDGEWINGKISVQIK